MPWTSPKQSMMDVATVYWHVKGQRGSHPPYLIFICDGLREEI